MSAILRKYISSRSLIVVRNKFFRCHCVSAKELLVEEIKIPVPWGHIAGKWWGSKNRRPVLCVHGWQDNANTFDKLIPQLPSDLSFLAIDLPGHGLSSYFPKGCFYTTYDLVGLLRRLQLRYNWDKLSLIGHSYGAGCSFLFACCFPNNVDFLVAIDAIKPLSGNPAKQIKNAPKSVEKLLRYESFTSESAPAYSRNDLLQVWIKGTNNSLNEESCGILINRGTVNVDGLLKLTRDSRWKVGFISDFNQREYSDLAKSVKCNVLYIKAKDAPYFEKKENVKEVVEIIKKNAKYFEYKELNGKHHIHLNNPELVTPVINDFIKKVDNKNQA